MICSDGSHICLILTFAAFFTASLQQLHREIDVTYKLLQQPVQCSHEVLDASALDFVGPVEINEVYVFAGKIGYERDVSGLRKCWTPRTSVRGSVESLNGSDMKRQRC